MTWQQSMTKREIRYLAFNLPFSMALLVLLVMINLNLIYQYNNWQPNEVLVITSFFLITLLIDFIVIALLKIFNKRMVAFTLLELVVLYFVIVIVL
jgi:hypothetical protein